MKTARSINKAVSRCRGCFLSLMFLFSLDAVAQNIPGEWNINLDMPSGNLDLTFDFSVRDEVLSGVVSAGTSSVGGMLFITNGVVQGNNLSFDLRFELGIQGSPIPTIRYSGRVNGDSMRLEGESDSIPLYGEAGAWQALMLTRQD